jgi:hypothetical protein
MTRIIRKEIVNGHATKNNTIEETKEDVIYDSKGLAEIDYTETTSMCNFCKIRFKYSNEEFWLPSFRLPEFKIKEKRK